MSFYVLFLYFFSFFSQNVAQFAGISRRGRRLSRCGRGIAISFGPNGKCHNTSKRESLCLSLSVSLSLKLRSVTKTLLWTLNSYRVVAVSIDEVVCCRCCCQRSQPLLRRTLSPSNPFAMRNAQHLMAY